MSYLNNLTIHELKYGGSRPSTANLMDLVMAHITAGQLRSCTHGELLSGKAQALLSGVSIDTRTLQPADLFFAIRGPRHDGHLFVEEEERFEESSRVREKYNHCRRQFPRNP